LDSIEQLDRDLEQLINKCRRSNLFFILTSDHGMTFEGFDKRSGGHSSAKYSKAKESTTIPLIIYGPNVKPSFVDAKQEDIAPTILSLFNIFNSQNLPRFSGGTILPAKDKVAVTLLFPQNESIHLYALDNGNICVFSSDAPHSSYSISGLKTGAYLLKWDQSSASSVSVSASSASSIYTQTEYTFFIEKDMTIDASIYLKKSNSPSASVFMNPATKSAASNVFFTKIHIFLIIGLINIIGIGLICIIYKKRR
jgi:hypothetical protein